MSDEIVEELVSIVTNTLLLNDLWNKQGNEKKKIEKCNSQQRLWRLKKQNEERGVQLVGQTS